jgi:hypothetical protein
MTGTDTDKFSPQTPATRAMIVTILYRLRGEPDVAGIANPFDDVSNGVWYSDAVKWAAANDIVNGIDGGRFAPEIPITRQDLAVILSRFDEFGGGFSPVAGPVPEFADWSDIEDYARDAVSYLAAWGVLNGKPGNIFDPLGIATRAEIAAVLHRFLES